ncbi:MAG: hypothetical protein JKY48_00745 [Flavobacteriales bacterium]|nr:hypothetical protein [Flavobacteriales bacterium]
MSDAITVILDGKNKEDISDRLISLSVEYEVNNVPWAELSMLAGDFANRKYPLFQEGGYKVGKELDIKIRYEGASQKEQSIFKGIITKRKFESRDGLPLMVLGLNDPSFQLKDAVNTAFFINKNDEEMIKQTLKPFGGLSLKKANAGLSSFKFDQYVKKQTTGWRFILDRIKAHGMLMSLSNGAMKIVKLDETEGELKLDVGIDNIIEIALEEDVSALNKEIKLNYWDVEKNESMELKRTFSGASEKKINASSSYVFLDITSKAEANAMLDYFGSRQELNQVKGAITILGNSSVRLMQKLSINSLPSGFKDNYPITNVSHKVKLGMWTTKVGIGISNFSLLNGNRQKEAQSNKNKEVEIAKALKWEKDPQGLGRVPVQVMAFGKEKYWAYPAQMTTGSKQRSFILPEEGEQVVLGFMHNTYNQGVILTSVYLKKNPPKSPFKMDAKSPVGFISKEGLQLIFDDEKKKIQITTPKESKLILSDGDGIDLKSKKDINLDSKGKISLKASGTVKVKGQTINLN